MQNMWEEISPATYDSCVNDTHFYQGRKKE